MAGRLASQRIANREMTPGRINEVRAIFAQGKRGATIAAGEELIRELAVAMAKQPKARKPRQTTMFSPTIEEVKAYAKEIGLNGGEEINFFDYHQARGWKMGKTGSMPMRDFKAAMRTWQRNFVKFAKAAPGNGKRDIGGTYGIG